MESHLTKHKLTIALIATLALAAPAFAAPDMIPTAPGNKWEFKVAKLLRANITYQGNPIATLNDPASGTSVYEVTSVDNGASPPVYDYRETTNVASVNGSSDTSKTQLYVTHENGELKIVSTTQETSGDQQAEKQVYNPPLMYYIASAAGADKTWDVGEIRDGDTINPTSARGAGRETVTVPAGTFKDCLKVVYTTENATGTIDLWDKKFNITSGRSRGIYWIADGVGVVKELEVSTSRAETPGPEGKPVVVEAATCTVSELMPGYVVK